MRRFIIFILTIIVMILAVDPIEIKTNEVVTATPDKHFWVFSKNMDSTQVANIGKMFVEMGIVDSTAYVDSLTAFLGRTLVTFQNGLKALSDVTTGRYFVMPNGGYFENDHPDTMRAVEANFKTEGQLVNFNNYVSDDLETNTFMGVMAGNANTTGSSNTFIGNESGEEATTGFGNTFLGRKSGDRVSIGYSNTLIGYGAGATSGACWGNIIGNVCVGYEAGNDLAYVAPIDGAFNTFLGYKAGDKTTTGSYNILIGNEVECPDVTGDYQINIGNVYKGTQNDSTAIISKNFLAQSVQRTFYVDYATTDTTCYVVSKYNDEYDLVSRWQNCMANDLFTFYKVGLKSNTSNMLSYTGLSTVDVQLIYGHGSDAIGPINVSYPSLRSGSTGANHVTGAYKTAKNMSYDIYIDGQKIKEGFKGYADNVEFRVHNELYNPLSGVVENRNKIIDEYVSYRLTNNTIEVNVEHQTDSLFMVEWYYGMQNPYFSVTETWKDSVYIAHSDSAYYCDFGITLKSGAINEYPNVEKAIYASADKSKTVTMWMDNLYGLPADTAKYMYDNTLNKFIHYGESNGKGYFRIMDNYSVTGTDTWSWRGSYTFEDQSANAGTIGHIASGLTYINGKPSYYADVKDTCNIIIPREMANMKVSAWQKDSAVLPTNELNSYYQTINASGYGNVYYQESPSQGDLTVDGKLTVNGAYNYGGSEAGGDDDYVVTISGLTLQAGLIVTFLASDDNTGACTLNVNSLGAKAIKDQKGDDPADSYIDANSFVMVAYDGTNFVLLTPDANP